jgi:hypothetical protein
MLILFKTWYSPIKGQRMEPGSVVDVANEIALDLIQRGIATPVRIQAEHAVGPGQGGR